MIVIYSWIAFVNLYSDRWSYKFVQHCMCAVTIKCFLCGVLRTLSFSHDCIIKCHKVLDWGHCFNSVNIWLCKDFLRPEGQQHWGLKWIYWLISVKKPQITSAVEGRDQNQNVFKTSCRNVTSFVTVTLHTDLFNVSVSSYWCQILFGARNRYKEKCNRKRKSDIRSNWELNTEEAYFTPQKWCY